MFIVHARSFKSDSERLYGPFAPDPNGEPNYEWAEAYANAQALADRFHKWGAFAAVVSLRDPPDPVGLKRWPPERA